MSFVVMHSCVPSSGVCTGLQDMHDNVVSEKDHNACLGPYFSSRISYATLNNSSNVFNGRKVIQYAGCPKMTCSTHKCHIGNKL